MSMLWFLVVSKQILAVYRAFSGGYLTQQNGRRMCYMITSTQYITGEKEMIATLFCMKRWLRRVAIKLLRV